MAASTHNNITEAGEMISSLPVSTSELASVAGALTGAKVYFSLNPSRSINTYGAHLILYGPTMPCRRSLDQSVQ
jgi:hypothetical protein